MPTNLRYITKLSINFLAYLAILHKIMYHIIMSTQIKYTTKSSTKPNKLQPIIIKLFNPPVVDRREACVFPYEQFLWHTFRDKRFEVKKFA